MGSSSGKKHKKDKKHRHRSRSPHSSSETRREPEFYDLTDAVDEETSSSRGHHHRHHKHKKHKEHRHRHKHHHKDYHEVIDVQDEDSDSSDCVVVPVDSTTSSSSKRDPSYERERSAPSPPKISRHGLEYETERYKREKEREYEKERERERERDKERARYERERAKELEREKERARYEREKEIEREREREKERARYEREREVDRRREREADREFVERLRDKARDRERNREDERERSNKEYRHQDRHERLDRIERSERSERSDKVERSERVEKKERSFSPIPENGAGDVLSIEETNKLRAKLGLKPLEMDSGSSKPPKESATETKTQNSEYKDLSSYKDDWGEFKHKPADNLQEKAEAEKLRDRLKQRKEKRFLEQRLARIRGLGESDDDGDDVSQWVQRNKRITDQRKEADMRAKALEEMDAELGVNELIENEKKEQLRNAYNEKHLKGLRVDHDMEEFGEGKTVILTLKDKGVLDETEDDTLINVNMIDNERYRKNVANKKLNPLSYGYNVYEEQYDELGNPIERNILEKYDEDLDGNSTVKRNFVLGENLDEERAHQRKLLEIKTKLAGKRLETLADTRIELASDTFSAAEIATFKKPKKKIKKLRQKLKAEDLLPLENEQNFGSRSIRHRQNGSDDIEDIKEENIEIKNEDDEEDLQRVLSKARKLKQKENIIKKPLPIDIEEIKREIIKNEPLNNDNNSKNDNDDDDEMSRNPDHNIILNATAEFCRTLGDIPTYGMAGNRDEDSNDMMDFEVNDNNEDHIHDDDDDEQLNHGTWNSVHPDEVMKPAEFGEDAEDIEERAILDEEPDVGAGVANALRLALSKGYLEKEEHNRPSNSKMSHLQAKNYSIEDKSTAEDEKFGRRDRYHAGPIMDFKDKDTFKPNVKLDYIDDNGRVLNLKEAFRYLSHKFHGKGPGKNKIEKRLKKMEQDGLMKTMSSTDTPLGTLTMLQLKQKETKTPYVVLSGGKQTTNVSGSTISKYK